MQMIDCFIVNELFWILPGITGINNLLFHNRQSHSCYIRSALYLRNISFSAFCDRSLAHCSVITAPAVQKRCSEGTLDCGAPRYVNATDARKRNLALLSRLATMQACHCSEVQVTQLGNSPVQYGLVEDELVGSCSVIWLLSLAALVELVCASSSSTQSRKLIWDDSARQGFFQLNWTHLVLSSSSAYLQTLAWLHAIPIVEQEATVGQCCVVRNRFNVGLMLDTA